MFKLERSELGQRLGYTLRITEFFRDIDAFWDGIIRRNYVQGGIPYTEFLSNEMIPPIC
jgi:hypothetical protein